MTPADKLRAFVREQAPGQCKLLSKGNACDCLLCCIDKLAHVPEEKARTDAALRACDGLSTIDLAGNKRGWLAELCYDAHKLDEPYRYGAQKCLAIVKEMRAALVHEDGVDYGILSRIEYRLQKVVDAPVAPLPETSASSPQNARGGGGSSN